jgi:hypothetical protein
LTRFQYWYRIPYLILLREIFVSRMANVFIVAPESLSTLFEGTPSIRKDAQRYRVYFYRIDLNCFTVSTDSLIQWRQYLRQLKVGFNFKLVDLATKIYSFLFFIKQRICLLHMHSLGLHGTSSVCFFKELWIHIPRNGCGLEIPQNLSSFSQNSRVKVLSYHLRIFFIVDPPPLWFFIFYLFLWWLNFDCLPIQVYSA